MAQQSLSFIVSPRFLPGVGNSQEATPTSSWAITNRQHQDIDKVVIDIADLSGKPVNLYYELDPESATKRLADSLITVRYLLMHKIILTIR